MAVPKLMHTVSPQAPVESFEYGAQTLGSSVVGESAKGGTLLDTHSFIEDLKFERDDLKGTPRGVHRYD